MTIEEVRGFVGDLTENFSNPIRIEISLFQQENGLKKFNKIIRERIENRRGIYVWENADSGEIIYIGMAGKVCQNGEFTSHDIQKRMLASRGKDSISNNYIQTNAYIKTIMISNNINYLNIHPFYSLDGILPGYIEASLLNQYFQVNFRLPLLNSHF